MSSPVQPPRRVRHRVRPATVAQREIVLHGQPVTYLEAGADTGGPVVVLLHGLASSSQTWATVLPLLGVHTHVIAPDLLGHGLSANPAAATTRWAPTPPDSGICWSPWAFRGPRS